MQTFADLYNSLNSIVSLIYSNGYGIKKTNHIKLNNLRSKTVLNIARESVID